MSIRYNTNWKARRIGYKLIWHIQLLQKTRCYGQENTETKVLTTKTSISHEPGSSLPGVLIKENIRLDFICCLLYYMGVVYVVLCNKANSYVKNPGTCKILNFRYIYFLCWTELGIQSAMYHSCSTPKSLYPHTYWRSWYNLASSDIEQY